MEKIININDLTKYYGKNRGIEKLSYKTGKKKEQITQLVNYINWLKTKANSEISSESLIKLNKFIEAFYKQ